MDLKEQYDKLLRYCYAKTKDRYLAEDIVQETFLKFWQAKSYKDTGKELAYLYTIARNLCMDEFRKVRTEDIENLSDRNLQYGNIDDDIDRIELNHALDMLPDDLREIVILRYANEVSVTDIGEIMGVSRFVIHRRLKEGLSMLRSMIEGDEEK